MPQINWKNWATTGLYLVLSLIGLARLGYGVNDLEKLLVVRSWLPLALIVPILLVNWVLNRCLKLRFRGIRAGQAQFGRGIVPYGVFLAPVAEEIGFRVFMGLTTVLALGRFWPEGLTPWTVIAVTSLIFGFLHISPQWKRMVDAAAGGVFLSVAMLLGGVPVAIALHALRNLIGLTFEYYKE